MMSISFAQSVPFYLRELSISSYDTCAPSVNRYDRRFNFSLMSFGIVLIAFAFFIALALPKLGIISPFLVIALSALGGNLFFVCLIPIVAALLSSSKHFRLSTVFKKVVMVTWLAPWKQPIGVALVFVELFNRLALAASPTNFRFHLSLKWRPPQAAVLLSRQHQALGGHENKNAALLAMLPRHFQYRAVS